MAQLEIILAADAPKEMQAFELWIEQWRSQLSHISPNRGCGCCVDIFEVEGTEESLADFNRRFDEIHKIQSENALKLVRAQRNARRNAAKKLRK